MALKSEQDKIAHLLRRFGLGASEAEMEYYGSAGLAGAIDRLLNYEAIPLNFDVSVDALRNPQNNNLNIRGAQVYWYTRVICTNRPLEERMTMFWHDHFATSAQKVDIAEVMLDHVDMLRKNCLGKFGELLYAVSTDQAMLYWLDNHENVKGKPNENFAREVMELFTLGIGHYTEQDIREAARAFTGWTFGFRQGQRIRQVPKPARRTQFVFHSANHDEGVKTVLGRRGNLNGDDVLKLLCEEAQTSKFLVHKMWEWFAYVKPEPALVERLAARFRQSGLDIKVLVRAIMESPEFYSEKAEKGVIKDPVFFCVSTARALGIGQVALAAAKEAASSEQPAGNRGFGPGLLASQSTKAMGMELLFPPDVAGWNYFDEWISSATMVERIKWADRVFGAQSRPGQAQQFGAFLFGLYGQTPDPTSAVRRLMSLYHVEGMEAKTPALVEAARVASNGRVTPGNSVAVARAVSRLIFGSPEFQFC